MPRITAVVGTDAVAEAMRQINPDVVPAYPITPQTAIVETFSEMIANGKVSTHMINVESEHSAMSAAIGASAAGARVMTATASQGLALMWEMLYIASGLRLPLVMANVNRSLSAPINIHCDHSDSMGARDSGWIQLYSENGQEAYDNTLQAVRIAEHPAVMLPVMVLLDGFIISHAIDRVEFLEDDIAKKFVGSFKPDRSLLDPQNPVTFGSFDGLHGYYFEYKRAQQEGMLNAFSVIKEVGKEYGEL
ncbi:MAG TPA: pyruvate ferredoxin oxidoreductase, partial [Firmicutes bacterium]|nr:pyruvate ferredoxin oxidoreductase [Bacillota bacterium]